MNRLISIGLLLSLVVPGFAQKTCGGRVKLSNIWDHLARVHDKDKDGRITAEEFSRGKKQFANHDRDGDGVITAQDFPADRFWNGFGPGIARRADRDGDRVVTKKEWEQFVSRLDANGDGEIAGAEFRKMAGPIVAGKPKILALSFDQDGDGKIEVTDFESLFVDLDRNNNGKLDTAELRGNKSLVTRSKSDLPKVGQVAPDFDLPRCDDPKKSVRLWSFAGSRPVALIFGSYT